MTKKINTSLLNIVESEWFANDGPIDAKPKYDFEVKLITQPKFDFEVKPITSVGPKCDLEGAGLLKLGNTCFLNVVLQCFMHTVPLIDILLHTHVVPCDFVAGFYLICVFKELIGFSLAYEAYEGRSISPWRFVENLSCILAHIFRLVSISISKKMLTNSCNTFSIGLKADAVTLTNKFLAAGLSASFAVATGAASPLL
ncbi:hypothetical protein T459_35133 [Capsicum annuum]|uniref:Peptidase C19 ubiquitin carboxyl-terminal hydrolase domain-containing protein n=1 Tax=Capsicum annuum TaxID=4072 RepID=A0A2G2XU39_CAPAN|nr:hypothetical protein T459_35133 [Capsicum annuum]